MAIDDFFDKTVTIYRPSSTRDAIGGKSETYTPSGPFPCRHRALSGNDVIRDLRDAPDIRDRLYLNPDVVVYEKDFVKISDNVTTKEYSFKVVYIRRCSDLQTAHHIECDIQSSAIDFTAAESAYPT